MAGLLKIHTRGYIIIKGDTFQIPFQIVVTKDLNENDSLWLKALQNDISGETAKKLLRSWNNAGSEYETQLIDSVMHVSFKENAEAFDSIKEEVTMHQALWDFMKPEIDEYVEQAVEQAVDQAVGQTVIKANNVSIEKLANWLKGNDPSLSDEEALQSAKVILS